MRFLSIPALLLTAGCLSVNPGTLAKVAALSPLTADPALMGVEVDLPEGLVVQKDTAIMTFFSARSDTGEAVNEDFVLEVVNGSQYRFAPSDLDRLRTTQTKVRRWEAEAPRANSGGLSIRIGPCVVGDGPAENARGSIRIRLDESGNFYPLITNGSLSKVLGDDDLSKIPDCNTTVQ